MSWNLVKKFNVLTCSLHVGNLYVRMAKIDIGYMFSNHFTTPPFLHPSHTRGKG
jgi:hypothetical protein